jgi:hypothetical protein
VAGFIDAIKESNLLDISDGTIAAAKSKIGELVSIQK